MNSRLHLCILGSGSKGNAAILEGPRSSLMIDCGLSFQETVHRCQHCSVDLQRISALLLTHEHVDHTRGAISWYKHFGTTIISTAETAMARKSLSQLPIECIGHSDTFEISGICIQSFPTSHDAADPIGFRFSLKDPAEKELDTVGFCTDTGYLTIEACNALYGCRILGIEANHDKDMLTGGTYPAFLKERVRGRRGHLSNCQTAEALPSLLSKKTEAVVALHLSEQNNRPQLCMQALAEAAGAIAVNTHLARTTDGSLSVYVASQDHPLFIQ